MRYKRIRLSGVFMTMMFTNGVLPHAKVTNGLPEGTRFAYSIPDTDYGVWIVVEHHSFPELKDGDVIPILEPPLCELIFDES